MTTVSIRPMAKRVATGAFAVLVAGSLSFPSLAFAASEVTVGDKTYTEAANGEGSGGGTWAWDGADDMTLVDYVGAAIAAVGDLNLNLEGDNEIEAAYTDSSSESKPAINNNVAIQVIDGDLTINGDKTKAGDDKPSLTIKGNSEHIKAVKDNSEDSDYNGNAKIDVYGGDLDINYATVKTDATYSSISAEGVTPFWVTKSYQQANTEQKQQIAEAWDKANPDYYTLKATEKGNVTINTSLLGGTTANKSFYVGATGTASFIESVVDATDIYSYGLLTIDHSDVTVQPKSESAIEYLKDNPNANWLGWYKHDDGTYASGRGGIVSYTGITLKNVLDGAEVKTVTIGTGDDAYTMWYIDSGSRDKVVVEADGEPGYYSALGNALPNTGDSTYVFALVAGLMIIAAASAGAFALRQRRNN